MRTGINTQNVRTRLKKIIKAALFI